MKIGLICFKSENRKTPFAPEWNYIIGESKIENVNFEKVTKLILDKKKEILKLPFEVKNNKVLDGYTGLGKNSTTSRYNYYNVLSWQDTEIKKMKNNILNCHNNFLKLLKLDLPKELYIRCWVNIIRTGEKIKPHLHSVNPYTYLGGHIVITYNNTSTFYINPVNQINDSETYESKNEVGKLTLFQNCIPHYTSENKSIKERITIAFDLQINKSEDNLIKLI